MATGCKSPTAAHGPVSNFAHINPATSGSIAGVVRLDGPAPKRIRIDMAQDPACSAAGGENMTEQYVVAEAAGHRAKTGTEASDGGMANVLVYVSSGLDAHYAPSSTPAVLDQKGCRYIPHVVAAQVGQPVEFRNSDATMHNVHIEPDGNSKANAGFNVSQVQGDTNRHIFRAPEVMVPVRCNNHPWMQAYLNIVPNPFFAVSDSSGHYSINGLPPGTYTLTAVHENLGPQQETITVTSHGTTSADFHFSQRPGTDTN